MAVKRYISYYSLYMTMEALQGRQKAFVVRCAAVMQSGETERTYQLANTSKLP